LSDLWDSAEKLSNKEKGEEESSDPLESDLRKEKGTQFEVHPGALSKDDPVGRGELNRKTKEKNGCGTRRSVACGRKGKADGNITRLKLGCILRSGRKKKMKSDS